MSIYKDISKMMQKGNCDMHQLQAVIVYNNGFQATKVVD